MSDQPLDVELAETMDSVFAMIQGASDNHDTDDQLRLRVVAHNLRALAQVFMIVHDHEDMALDPMQIALGLLGTADWIMDKLPEIEGSLELPDF